jgi:hypothetical protein
MRGTTAKGCGPPKRSRAPSGAYLPSERKAERDAAENEARVMARLGEAVEREARDDQSRGREPPGNARQREQLVSDLHARSLRVAVHRLLHSIGLHVVGLLLGERRDLAVMLADEPG